MRKSARKTHSKVTRQVHSSLPTSPDRANLLLVTSASHPDLGQLANQAMTAELSLHEEAMEQVRQGNDQVGQRVKDLEKKLETLQLQMSFHHEQLLSRVAEVSTNHQQALELLNRAMMLLPEQDSEQRIVPPDVPQDSPGDIQPQPSDQQPDSIQPQLQPSDPQHQSRQSDSMQPQQQLQPSDPQRQNDSTQRQRLADSIQPQLHHGQADSILPQQQDNDIQHQRQPQSSDLQRQADNTLPRHQPQPSDPQQQQQPSDIQHQWWQSDSFQPQQQPRPQSNNTQHGPALQPGDTQLQVQPSRFWPHSQQWPANLPPQVQPQPDNQSQQCSSLPGKHPSTLQHHPVSPHQQQNGSHCQPNSLMHKISYPQSHSSLRGPAQYSSSASAMGSQVQYVFSQAKVPDFKGEVSAAKPFLKIQEVEGWLRSIENLVKPESPELFIQAARTSCKGRAERLINSPLFDHITNWQDFKAQVRQIFRGTCTTKDFFNMLYGYRMLEDQAPEDFFLELKGCVYQGYRDYPDAVGHPEELLRRVFLAGLPSWLSNALAVRDEGTVAQTAEAAQRVWNARKSIPGAEPPPRGRDHYALAVQANSIPPESAPQQATQRWCYYHETATHSASECRARSAYRPGCYWCGNQDHFIRDCPFYQSQGAYTPSAAGPFSRGGTSAMGRSGDARNTDSGRAPYGRSQYQQN